MLLTQVVVDEEEAQPGELEMEEENIQEGLRGHLPMFFGELLRLSAGLHAQTTTLSHQQHWTCRMSHARLEVQ